jgi:PAS domain S-box-containing protein
MANTLAALRRSLSAAHKIDQDMLRYVLDQSRDCIKILSAEGRVEYINSEGQCALKLKDVSTILGSYWPDLWPAESRPIIEEALSAAATHQGTTLEAWRPDEHDDKRWWQISVSPLLEATGELVGVLTMSRDITDHVRSREIERTMALEMRHRLRNAYTVASAIVSQSARGNFHQKAFAETVTARLADVALSQVRLLEAGQKSWTVAELIRTLVEAHGDGAGGIKFTGPAHATIDGHEAMLVALVIGELTNNSLKYGALRAGKIVHLTWTSGSALKLRWREPLAAPLTGPLGARDHGSGYSLMSRMARSQKAKFEFEASDLELKASLTLAPQPAAVG